MANKNNKSGHDPAATDATSENGRNSRHKRRNGRVTRVMSPSESGLSNRYATMGNAFGPWPTVCRS